MGVLSVYGCVCECVGVLGVGVGVCAGVGMWREVVCIQIFKESKMLTHRCFSPYSFISKVLAMLLNQKPLVVSCVYTFEVWLLSLKI